MNEEEKKIEKLNACKANKQNKHKLQPKVFVIHENLYYTYV